MQVMRNGSHSMHAVDDVTGVSVAAPINKQQQQQQQRQQQQQQQLVARVLSITPLDSPLVSPGEPLVLPNVQHQPDLAKYGVNFNLHNNLWGTNYVMWVPYQHTEDSSSNSRGSWHQRCKQGKTAAAAAVGGRDSSSMAAGRLSRLLISIRAALQLAVPLQKQRSGIQQQQQQQQQVLGHASSSSSRTSAAADAVDAAAAAVWNEDGWRAALADQRVAVFR
jgi:hypothetical protein